MNKKKDVYLMVAAYTACAAGLLYALPHFWWGLGISVAFPGDYNAAPDDPVSQFIAYWLMGMVSMGAALFALAFVHSWGQRIPRMLLLIPAWIAAVGLITWGLGFVYLRFFLAIGRVLSAPEFVLQDSDLRAIGWGLFWYSLFVIWGVSLWVAARRFQHRRSFTTGENKVITLD
ncbi:DUF3995 domain-containing protein [Halalkalibacter urbisdiaboli]|uniref:DUF3995 domain-containing protein n=1 Tax=Halalkalibacter urbisdiaboli TaxID=1960589 RepID=UPI000B44BB29|nr:DUF3995 domain-containing protein [Halalkalibacter urbisdiaboli]